MSEPARIALRLLGVVLLALGVVIVVAMFVPGPGQIANWMGNSCAHETNGPSEQCSVFDVLEILAFAPMLIFVGGIMALALRPESSGPITINLGGRGR
jgi:hypothetical protein